MLLHLGPNVITFRTLLHLGPNVITFRTLLHLGQLLHLGLQHPSPLNNSQALSGYCDSSVTLPTWRSCYTTYQTLQLVFLSIGNGIGPFSE